MLYARLLKMKELSDELKDKPPHVASLNPTAAELGLQKESRKHLLANIQLLLLLKRTDIPNF